VRASNKTSNKVQGEKIMKYLWKVTSATIALAFLVSATATAQVSKDGMGKVLPVELYTCSYINGKGPADLDKVIGRWSKFADDNGINNYMALTLTPFQYGPDQKFDVIWMGAFADGNAMGTGLDNYLTKGGDIQKAFNEVVKCDAHVMLSSAMYKSRATDESAKSAVITMMDCKLNKGHRYVDIKSAELKWAEYLTSHGSKAGYWHWFPVYGGGDADYDYKVVFAYSDYKELGADFELNANGGGRDAGRDIFDDIDDCDDARVYLGTVRRYAKLR
jgi:hypothetical protein